MAETFRKASIQDFKEISALYHAAVDKMTENQIFQWDEIYPDDEVLLKDILQGEMYLLEAEDRIASCVVLNEEQDELYRTGTWKYTDGRAAVIHRLCVHPDIQGVGIGKKTVQLIEAAAKDKGYNLIRLDAFSQNKHARNLYQNLGYTYAGEVHFRKGMFYLMEKAL
jgi:ribosomal protein S18 acetylase RimI-like enzyme